MKRKLISIIISIIFLVVLGTIIFYSPGTPEKTPPYIYLTFTLKNKNEYQVRSNEYYIGEVIKQYI